MLYKGHLSKHADAQRPHKREEGGGSQSTSGRVFQAEWAGVWGIGVRRETQGKQPTGALSAVAKTTDSGPAPWSEVRIQAEAAGWAIPEARTTKGRNIIW